MKKNEYMEHDVPPLLVIADLPPGFNLANLRLSDRASELAQINHAKHQGLETQEAILDGMTFTLRYFTAEETHYNLAIDAFNRIFCERPSESSAGIGISLGNNISNTRHIATVNRAFLQLAQLVGESIDATGVAWVPADQISGFEYYTEAVAEYVNGGPMPALVQVGISESIDGVWETTGLRYFANQEIRMETPPGFPPKEATKRLVRIIHDVATNGKIDNEIETTGLSAGENILFRPNQSQQILNVLVSTS